MRTAWISSVIFSFVAVLGVGGFSFFLISSKSGNSEPTIASQDAELADSEVFASAILPMPGNKTSLTEAVLPEDNQKAATEQDYEIFETDDIGISDVVVDSTASSQEDVLAADSPLQIASSKLNAQGRLTFRGVTADENELSRRIVPEPEQDNLSSVASDASWVRTKQRFQQGAAAMQAQRNSFEDIPAEMEPELLTGTDTGIYAVTDTVTYAVTDKNADTNSREAGLRRNRFEQAEVNDNENSSDIDALVALNKFNAKNNFQPALPRTTSRRQSLDNLLVQDDGFEELHNTDKIEQVKASIDDASVGLFDSDAMATVRDDVIAIIVHRENSENISISDVKNIYVDKRMNWGNGGKIITYNLPLDTNGREIFSQSVLDMSAIQAATEASNRVITNAAYNRSHTKGDRLIISYVSRNPQAIGYVPLKAAKQSSKVRIILTMQP